MALAPPAKSSASFAPPLCRLGPAPTDKNPSPRARRSATSHVRDPVGCVNTISLQTGQIRTADAFTYPTGQALVLAVSSRLLVAQWRNCDTVPVWPWRRAGPFRSRRTSGTARAQYKPFRHAAAQLVTLDVIGQPVTLSEREAEELRHAAAADAGRSTARRDLSVLLDRGLRAKTTVVLNRAEARELAELLTADGFSTNLALLREALLLALA